MKKHFVTFFSPGTFIAETSSREVESWDVKAATDLARTIKERYGATPYGFQFTTRERGADDFNSRETERSPMYYLGGTILTLQDVKDRNDPKDSILISNMEYNGWERIIQNDNSWRSVQPLHEGDEILEFEKEAQAV